MAGGFGVQLTHGGIGLGSDAGGWGGFKSLLIASFFLAKS